MSDVTLNDKIGPEGRATIYFRGRQVGYYRQATHQVQFAPVHQDERNQELILSELEALIGGRPDSITNPPFVPPESAAEPLDEFDPDDE